jgi:hypothetical protein
MEDVAEAMTVRTCDAQTMIEMRRGYRARLGRSPAHAAPPAAPACRRQTSIPARRRIGETGRRGAF